MQYWLIKSEPSTFSIEDLAAAPKKTTCWDGVRNYQARNFMKAMRKGDRCLFYHSNAAPPAAVGIAEVVKEAYPDHTALDEQGDHYDPKASVEKPIWEMVDVKLVAAFPRAVSLDELRGVKALSGMELLRKGSRLSVMPVTAAEFRMVEKLAASKP
ncbi:MAG: EVE domain-containing protein [Pirellulales bacterium]|jgi:predicted RNA-binding protein with PUA-like domain